jgi:hypothetical protein
MPRRALPAARPLLAPPLAWLFALPLALLLGSPLTQGCASAPPPPPTPESTVQAFARAINSGKLEEAYALMSGEYRSRVSLEQWKKRLTEQPQEALELSNALGSVREPADQRAYVRYDDGEQLELRREGERWYLATNVADFYDQSTPRAALRAFVRAMERKRYDIVMRLVPTQDKEGITTERMEQAWSGPERESVERMLSALREHLDAPIEIVGNRATMPYGEHARVQLVREGDAWKVEDPE